MAACSCTVWLALRRATAHVLAQGIRIARTHVGKRQYALLDRGFVFELGYPNLLDEALLEEAECLLDEAGRGSICLF